MKGIESKRKVGHLTEREKILLGILGILLVWTGAIRLVIGPAGKEMEELRHTMAAEKERREHTLTKEMFWDEASWEIQLEFFEPEYGRVKARVMVLEDEELLWREERTFISLYEEGRDNGR